MGEYEPDDSRDVTLNANEAPGEPPRTGPREDQARAEAQADQQAEQETEKQGIADPEPEDKPTARDAHGNKQPGYATDEDRQDGEETKQQPPLGK